MQKRSKNRYIYFVSLVIISYIIFNTTSFYFPDRSSMISSIPYSHKLGKTRIDDEISEMIDQIKIKPASGIGKVDEEKPKVVKGDSGTISNHEEHLSKINSDNTVDITLNEPAKMESRILPNVPFNIKNIKNLDFRIYSHNVKNSVNEYLVDGELKWNDRYKQISSSISFHTMPNTIVTLQEVYDFQLNDILNELNRFSEHENQEWKAYGVGRIDGQSLGEFVPILYRPSEWDLVFNDTIWLNENNERYGVIGWDAAYLRIVSYVTLKSKSSGDYINVFNTHLDHVGVVSRSQSIRQIAKRMEDINKWPSFLCGDLNFEPSEEPYKAISGFYTDVAKLTTDVSYGHEESTLTGFKGEVLKNGGQNIDYIFCPKYTLTMNQDDCNSKGKIKGPVLKLKRRGMLHSKFNGDYMSDHRPLVADFILREKC